MRQFISEVNFDKNGIIKLSNKDYKYLKQVLRTKIGDMVCVRVPDGSLYNATVANILEKSKEIILQVCDTVNDSCLTGGINNEEFNKEKINYWLFQFIPKPVKMEQIIRQATECGIKYIVPIKSEFSQKSSILAMESSKVERFNRIIKEARQQSGSPVETELLNCMSLNDVIILWNKIEMEKTAVVLWEQNSNTKKLSECLNNKNVKNVAIVVGSEGGISPTEINELMNNNFVSIHFDTNILRCETAALYGIAAVQSYLSV